MEKTDRVKLKKYKKLHHIEDINKEIGETEGRIISDYH